MKFNKEEFLSEIERYLKREYQLESIKKATSHQLHAAIAEYCFDCIADDRKKSSEAHKKARRACYFSAEFLVGRAIYNNLLCLGIVEEVEKALKEVGASLKNLEDIEDNELGNGGLGRLAACFLDSAATLNMPLDGYGIRYRYGLFRQDIDNGYQNEYADNWSRFGDYWSKRCEKDTVKITFADQTVLAVPYDMPIIGYKTNHISNLRLWQAEPISDFNFTRFNERDYDAAVIEKNRAEDISRVLYPNDDTDEGKKLRLKQQYFFSSASIADILSSHKKTFGSLDGLAEHTTIQLNDTHPVISIPELIRQLVDDERMTFPDALSLARKVFNYTNHTVMAEALEKWNLKLITELLPRIAEIVLMIDAAFLVELKGKGYSVEKAKPLAIVEVDTLHMARMAIAYSSHTNGVAKIHTDILKNSALKEWYELYPERFSNKTNGITQRRWLGLANRELSSFIEETLHSDAFLTDLDELKKMAPYAEDEEKLAKFIEIKKQKKHQLAEYLRRYQGIEVDENSIFDIQIKRLHEYKRQLMNAFSILYIYFGIKDGSIKDFYPTTFIFGAKAAPGYRRAKGIIKFINEVGNLVSKDPVTKDLLKVVFVKNYNVSYAERLVTSGDVSEQISTAGTEASGTGNMKLMLNGTVTLGTYDGANVEIVQEAGEENNYIFGATAEQVTAAMKDYSPVKIYKEDPKIERVLNSLVDLSLSDGGWGVFNELYISILFGASYHRADNYYLLGDLTSYVNAKLRLNADYKNDQKSFYKKCFLNMANAGKFSSDRTIKDYAKEIWKIEPVKL